jgi:hypothetical protein
MKRKEIKGVSLKFLRDGAKIEAEKKKKVVKTKSKDCLEYASPHFRGNVKTIQTSS